MRTEPNRYLTRTAEYEYRVITHVPIYRKVSGFTLVRTMETISSDMISGVMNLRTRTATPSINSNICLKGRR